MASSWAPSQPGLRVAVNSIVEMLDDNLAIQLNNEGKVAFIPDAPYLRGPITVQRGKTSLAVRCDVEPDGALTQVEWGTTTAYGNYQPVPPIPAAPGLVTILLTGLTAATLYHFRVITSNAGRTTTSPDQTALTTP
jgi:hypothetical protein